MDLSLIICAYNMERELSRTIFTLSAAYQRAVEDIEYEIIVVDNGSTIPVSEQDLREFAPNSRVIRFEPGNPSPARAINTAMQAAKGRVLGLFIDGARLASPGIISRALQAHRSDPAKIVGTLGFHLGPDVQMRSMDAGYDQSTEDELLARTPWRKDGYTLFDISVLAGSSREGWFGNLKESNGVFMDKALWNDLGGLDERFEAPGGGLVNLDFWKRAVIASGYSAWIILGEGTFHQFHGGAATNGTVADRAAMSKEYMHLHGKNFSMPPYQAQFVGELSVATVRKFDIGIQSADRQAHSVFGRNFAVGIPDYMLETLQSGTMKTRYKGRRLLKNPFDLAIYLQLLQQLRPRTIVEIGTSEGGSATWLRDMCDALDLDCGILTLDINEPELPLDGASFYCADSTRPNETFPHERIRHAAHPFMVIEDSAHSYDSVRSVLEYFDERLISGDYMIIEDGVVADMRSPRYRQYEDGPNRAVRDFLLAHPESYEIDAAMCDFYGPNATYCPNGWLVRL